MDFQADLWEGMLGRLRQMLVTDSSEHYINWSLTVENHAKRQRLIKSVANMVFIRGDEANEKSTIETAV
jgi:hypothetical protein